MSIMTPPAPTSQGAPPGPIAVRELEQRLGDTRRAVVRQRLAAGLGAMGAAFAAALAIIAAADYLAELPFLWRALWLAGVLAATGLGGIWAWRRGIGAYTLARAAADAERRATRFGQRLRTTLDYEQDMPRPAPASPSLLTALQNDACQVARTTNWNDVVDGRPARVALTAAALVALCWSVALVASGEWRIAAGRALLLPLQFTTVTYWPRTAQVRTGESVDITVAVAGRPIASAELRYRSAGSGDEWTVVELVPVNDEAADGDEAVDRADESRPVHGALLATLADLEHDLEFEVVAGPRALAPGLIRVLRPLTLNLARARIVPPAYSGRPEETVEGLDLKVLEGSTVELRLELNRPAAEARLTLRAGGRDSNPPTETAKIPAARSDAGPTAEPKPFIDGSTICCTFADLRESSSFSILATTADGVELAAQSLGIRVLVDRRPQLRFVQPPEELVVTATTEVPMIVEAHDDIGLFKVGIMYQIGAEEMQTLCEFDAAGSREPAQLSQVLMLEDLHVTPRHGITYYAYAEDNYFGERRRTTTPLRFIDIRPYRLAFQLVEGGGTCNGCSTTLEELIARQRRNLSLAFAAQELTSPPAHSIERLGAPQAELLEKTREFEQGMTARAGLLPTLARAVRDMEEAVEAFASGNLPPAIVAQQEALADLIRTRENVRKKLSQSSSASACRQFDREQRQKLRRPEGKKETDKQQQLAGVRKKLDELAKRERQWAQECRQCNRSGEKSGGRPPTSQEQAAGRGKAFDQTGAPPNDSDSSPPERPSDARDPPEHDSQAPSPHQIAAAQENLHAELAELRARLDRLEAASAAARDQARLADETMQDGLDELNDQNGPAAARAGERSADLLERLADHLATMNARDFGQRLDEAQKLAGKLAGRQASLERQSRGKDLAHDERALASGAELLAEQLEALERDAEFERGDMQGKLHRIAAENPPRHIAGLLRHAADDLESGRTTPAAQGQSRARLRLDELSRSLGELRGEYAQPRLDELIALEEQVARLVQQMKRAHQPEGRAETAREKWRAIEDRLNSIATGDERLAEALRQLRAGPVGGPSPEGHGAWLERGDFSGIRQVSQVLQARIQEALLAGALTDSDQPVPPEYKDLVEKYYRALSDDLR